jgi:site-specific DNA recombinase
VTPIESSGTFENMRAAIYTRLSVERDGTVKAGRELQLRDCRRLVEAKGWTEMGVYSDRDASAYSAKAKRPEYDRLIADLKAGLIDAVVIWKLDRLTRGGMRSIARTLDLLHECDAVFVSVTETLDTSTAMGEGVVGIIASVAKQSSEDASLRIRNNEAWRAGNGKVHGGGRRAYGYTQQMEIVPDEADRLRWAAKQIMAGRSSRSICTEWNAAGIRSATGGRWHVNSLRRALTNPLQAGWRLHNGDRHQGDWVPIFDERTHLALVAALEPTVTGPWTPSRYLLTGLIVCGRCELPLTVSVVVKPSGARHYRYHCQKTTSGKHCGAMSVSLVATDRVVSEKALVFLATANLKKQGKTELKRLEKEAEADRAALEDLTRARFYDRNLTDTEYTETRRLLLERLERTEGEIVLAKQKEAPTGLPDGLDGLLAWWADPQVTQVDRRRASSLAFDRIRVLPAMRRGREFDESRYRSTGVNDRSEPRCRIVIGGGRETLGGRSLLFRFGGYGSVRESFAGQLEDEHFSVRRH